MTDRHMRTYTVTLSGAEREDGQKPYDYAVTADGLVQAIDLALWYHLNGGGEDDQVWVESCRPGFHRRGLINDLRHIHWATWCG